MFSRLTCFVGAILFAFATGAHSATVTVTATGTISFGQDQTGEFGAVGAFLTGKNFVAKYVFDTSLGEHYDNGSTQNYYYGGPWYGSAVPLTAMLLTIGGVTKPIPVHSLGYIGAQDDRPSGRGSFTFYVQGSNSYLDGQNVTDNSYVFTQYSDKSSAPHTIDPTKPQTYLATTGRLSGRFVLNRFDNNSMRHLDSAYGSFNVQTLTSGPAPVPVPAAGGLLMGGLGVLGLVRRRRAA